MADKKVTLKCIGGLNTLQTPLPKIKIEVVVKDDDLATVTEAITSSAGTGKIGDGKIFVSSLDDVIRIRTGETGNDAV